VVVAGVVWFGAARLGGLSTRAEPGTAERLLARYAKHVAVPREARTATNPLAFSPEVWAEARAHFADHCASCHANDGSGDTALGRNLYPKAPDMRQAATQSLSDGELYWIIENGIRLTGMPAWGTGGPDDADTWKLVHFLRRLKDLTAEDLAEMATLNPRTPAELREEQDDARFLSGDDTVPATPAPAHHHHQE
jgi:mono/diheme cytochrome c family protein